MTRRLFLVVVAAVVGDTVGYEVGWQVGTRVLRVRILDRHRGRLQNAQDFLASRGGSAVFLGRFVAFFRAVMPALAGTAAMRYSRFLAYNAAGGVIWGTSFVLLGYLAGNSYAVVEKAVGRGAALAVLALVVVALVIWQLRRRHAERRSHRQPAPKGEGSAARRVGATAWSDVQGEARDERRAGDTRDERCHGGGPGNGRPRR